MQATKTAISNLSLLSSLGFDTIPMSLFLSALSAAGVLECLLCSFLMAELAGCWLRGCFKTTSSFFSAAVALSIACSLPGRFRPGWGENAKRERANNIRKRNTDGR
jgi:hypothetical protein